MEGVCSYCVYCKYVLFGCVLKQILPKKKGFLCDYLVPFVLLIAAICKAVRPSGPAADAGDGPPFCDGRRSTWTICTEWFAAAMYSAETPLSLVTEAS